MFYGHRTNDDLLLNSGFVVENNKWDFLTVLFSLIQNDPLYEQKKNILESHNIPEFASSSMY